MKTLPLAVTALLLSAAPVAAEALSIDAINRAEPLIEIGELPDAPGARRAAVIDRALDSRREGAERSAALVRLQTLLDRAGASPVVIDGYPGQNTSAAIRAFERMRGLEPDGQLDPKSWELLQQQSTEPAARTHTLSEEDVDVRLVDLPAAGGRALKDFECLCYERHSEALAERFHMDEDLLVAMNPGVDFSQAGTTINVVDPGEPVTGKVTRVEVDKGDEMVRAYADDRLIFAARASIGSDSTPSPSGTMGINVVAPDPNYRWSAETLNQEGDEVFFLAAGPNNPVGGTWIDLKKEGYGIHGTPEPATIGRAESHGCVRLTNWDAEALSNLVVPGETIVEFTE